jgi:hypothetical protein
LEWVALKVESQNAPPINNSPEWHGAHKAFVGSTPTQGAQFNDLPAPTKGGATSILRK